MFKERFTSIKSRSDDDHENTPHDHPFLPCIQSSFKNKRLPAPSLPNVNDRTWKYFIICLRDGLHETQHRAMKDTLLTWSTQAVPSAQAEPISPGYGGCSEQVSCTFSPASTTLRTVHAAAAAHANAPDAWSAQILPLGCKTHLAAEDMPTQHNVEPLLNTRGLGWL